jgi:hypothetical protein
MPYHETFSFRLQPSLVSAPRPDTLASDAGPSTQLRGVPRYASLLLLELPSYARHSCRLDQSQRQAAQPSMRCGRSVFGFNSNANSVTADTAEPAADPVTSPLRLPIQDMEEWQHAQQRLAAATR